MSRFRRPGFVVAAVVVGLLVLVALVILGTSLAGGGGGPAVQPTAQPSGSAEPTPDSADASVCGLEGFETTDTLTQAPSTEWELVGTVAAPTDPEGAGPGAKDGNFRSCYAHTAEGALFAAVNWFAMSSDARNLERLPDLVEPGKGRDAAIAAAATATAAPSETRLQVAGFKINSYDGREAVVDVAWTVTSGTGEVVSLPTVLHWVDGDWKIVLTDSGEFPYGPSQLSNLGGYQPWSGV
jgi:hypothetical protein